MLKCELFIAASKEAKELYQVKLPKSGFFNCEAMILDEIYKKCINTEFLIDELSARVYFKETVISLIGEFTHFVFTKDNLYEDSIDLMFDFYEKIKLNDLSLSSFISNGKKLDIEKIFKKYEELKKSLMVIDKVDFLLNVNTKKITKFLNKYDSIFVDWQFFEENIQFVRSNKELKLFEFIKNHNIKIQAKYKQDYTENITLNKVFDFADEAKEAVKIAKVLLEKGESTNDIVIVASKLDGYKHSIQNSLDEYGVKGYITSGKDFTQSPIYYEMRDLTTQKNFNQYVMSSEKKLETLPLILQKEFACSVNTGLKVAKKSFILQESLSSKDFKISFKDIFEELSIKSNIEIENRLDAILIAEHNQVLKTKYKHIIYIGIDSTHLPQKFNDNFLYTSEDCEVLNISNYYKDAVYIYDRLKRNGENLHLVTAQYRQKRELQISSVITDNYLHELKEYTIPKRIDSLNDLLDEGKQTKIKDNIKDFIFAKQIKKQNEYNGVLNITNADDKQKGIRFSATRLNEYSNCPMKYFFNYVLSSKSPQDFNDDEFDAAEAGTLFHSVVEDFAKVYKMSIEKKLMIDIKLEVGTIFDYHYKNSLPLKDGKTHETVLHRLKKIELQEAVNRFIDYVEKGYLDNFESAEERFEFDMDGNSFVGIIDRIDIDNKNNKITLIDYKTTKAQYCTGSKDEKYQKLVDFKEFQLPLYHFFIEQDENFKHYDDGESYLLTYSGNIKEDQTHKKFGQTSSTISDPDKKIFLFDKKAKENYKKEIKDVATNINSGNFYFNSSEDSCAYCNHLTMCGNGIRVEKKF